MTQQRPGVAAVLRSYGATFAQSHGKSASIDQRRVLRDIIGCRTAALGGHKQKCDRCGHEQIAYNSCRNRHCPQCQAAARARWLDAREHDLLDVAYFHVVFTLPEPLGPLALQNKRAVYGILFRAAAETLQTIARDPKHLGADIGFLAVLHTWGQNLHHHPHLHCVVPGGGVSLNGQHWINCDRGFFLPVHVLSRMFRGKFLSYLQRAFEEGKLGFHGRLAQLADPRTWTRWLTPLRSRAWVVYAKPPFGGPRQVLRYLARYTHRVAISNQRILSVRDGQVTFRWKDYARGQRRCRMTLSAVEFIRRFLLHVLPKNFVHIRHYGFLANRDRGRKVGTVKQLLEQATATAPSPPPSDSPAELSPGPDFLCCPRCRQGHLVVVAKVEAQPWSSTPLLDTS
ncbi:MAG: IS91 family transposase [Planctomycetota bacterium]|jgi:hypothetical protein